VIARAERIALQPAIHIKTQRRKYHDRNRSTN
jgi:hypothetical protein